MSKKIFTLVTLLLLYTVIWAQQNNEQLWENANSLYAEEEYQQAIGLYEQILQNGMESASLYFNLGNAYYKAGDMNKAILNYERARLLAPQDEDIRFNLELANQYVVTKIDELPQPFFKRWRNKIVNLYPLKTWATLSIAAFILTLFLAGIFLFSRRISYKRLAFWSGIFFLFISALTFSLASIQKKMVTTRNHAIVFCPRVTIKSSPSQSGTDLFLIYEGVKVEVTDSLNKWKQIKLNDGNQGWLPDSCIVKI